MTIWHASTTTWLIHSRDTHRPHSTFLRMVGLTISGKFHIEPGKWQQFCPVQNQWVDVPDLTRCSEQGRFHPPQNACRDKGAQAILRSPGERRYAAICPITAHP